MLLFVLVSLASMTVGNGQNFNGGQGHWYCNILLGQDCADHDDHHDRCGTDGVTYKNMCELGKVHCVNDSVHQLHEGPCGVVPASTVSSVVHGSELILDYQCVILSHKDCTFAINEKICGTDGWTYQDFCEYEKARCTHRELHVAKMGDCAA